MIINKVINNNVLSTHDENNREIVLMGKGIGFQKKVGDEVAEDKIEKKFVLDSEDEVGKFSELIEMIPHNYLNLSVDIISYAQQVMSKRLSPSIYISLTDHINFLLERSTKGELFENPLFNEIKSFYPSEYLVGEKALELIESEAGIKLPQDEAASIALHFVIAEYNMGMSDTVNATTMIRECISIVEKELGIKLDELGLHCSRFITHLKFFAQRMFAGELLDNQDQEFLDMKIYVGEDYKEMSRKAANIMSAQIILKPDSVIGLATGSTPIGIYDQLVKWYEKGDLDFSNVVSINLDEYKGLSGDNDQSYRYFMNKHLFDRINIDKNKTYVPDGLEQDSYKACQQYNNIIEKSGGIDMQLLGLGHNGHIGFNEPGEAFEKETHCVNLTKSTIEANKRFFEREEDVPKQAYTMGIKSIMQAKKILIVVSGKGKADIVKKAFFGPVTPEVPASVLQLHNDVTLVGDRDALCEIL